MKMKPHYNLFLLLQRALGAFFRGTGRKIDANLRVDECESIPGKRRVKLEEQKAWVSEGTKRIWHLHAVDFKVVQSGQRVRSIADALKMDDGVFAADAERVERRVAALHLLRLQKNDFVDWTRAGKYLLRNMSEMASAQTHVLECP